MSRGGKREGGGRKSAFPGEEIKPVTFKLPIGLLEELKTKAEDGGTTQTAVVAQALRELFERDNGN